MRSESQAGFTVIEVMLFVAISGLMMAGLLIGTGTSIARQRYKDSVTTLHSNVQQVYEEVAAPHNDRVAAVSGCGGSVVAGASDCVLLGKLLVLNKDDMTYYDVIGTEPARSTTNSNEDVLLQSYQPRVMQNDAAAVRQAKLEWGASVRLRETPNELPISMLVLRSPESGFMYSYTVGRDMSIAREGEPLSTMVKASNKVQRTICVESVDVFSKGEKMALRVRENASSATAIEIISNQRLSDEGSAQC